MQRVGFIDLHVIAQHRHGQRQPRQLHAIRILVAEAVRLAFAGQIIAILREQIVQLAFARLIYGVEVALRIDHQRLAGHGGALVGDEPLHERLAEAHGPLHFAAQLHRLLHVLEALAKALRVLHARHEVDVAHLLRELLQRGLVLLAEHERAVLLEHDPVAQRLMRHVAGQAQLAGDAIELARADAQALEQLIDLLATGAEAHALGVAHHQQPLDPVALGHARGDLAEHGIDLPQQAHLRRGGALIADGQLALTDPADRPIRGRAHEHAERALDQERDHQKHAADDEDELVVFTEKLEHGRGSAGDR